MLKLILFIFSVILLNVPSTAAADDVAVVRFENADIDGTAEFVHHLYQKYPRTVTLVAIYPLLYSLAVIALYTDNPTYTALLKIINLQNDDQILRTIPKVTPIITSSDAVDADFALRVYGDISNPFYVYFVYDIQDFLRTSNGGTSGRVQSINYNFPAHAANLINYGVRQEATQCKTGNEDIVSVNMVANYKSNSVVFTAAYNFYGNWEYAFNPRYTTIEDFYTGYGVTVKVPLMYRVGNYGYANINEMDAKVLVVPYKNYKYSLMLIFPNQASNFPILVNRLRDPDVFRNVQRRVTTQELQIYIPKGEVCRNVDLLKNLEEIVRNDDIFSDDVYNVFNSGRIANISDILETVHIKVDEGNGATNYGILNPNSRVPIVRVDRAFLYYVLERTDSVDSPVLAGTFVNPYII